MNERKKVNKIIHTYVDVSKYEDYTDYKGLITALIDWKNEQLTLTDVSQQRGLLVGFINWHDKTLGVEADKESNTLFVNEYLKTN